MMTENCSGSVAAPTTRLRLRLRLRLRSVAARQAALSGTSIANRRPRQAQPPKGNGFVLNHERLTIKAAEAVQAAAHEAARRGNPALEDVHLLQALLTQDETVVVPVLQKVGAHLPRLQ